jgi:NitT/TauT family transport system permease protein
MTKYGVTWQKKCEIEAMTENTQIFLWRVLVAIGLLGSWEVSSGLLFDSFWLSQPSEIAVYLRDAALSGQLYSDLSTTFSATAYGYVLGAVFGLFFGLILSQSERIALILRPFIMAIYGIPRIALAPIFILWFGIAMTSKIMMAAMMTFMYVFFNTYEGIRASDLELKNVARVLGANRFQLFWYVTLPNASPWIIAGLRIAIPQSLVAAVVAEFIASTGGLGYRLMETTSSLDTPGTMAGIFILMVIVMGLNSGLDKGENYILKWRPKDEK